MLAAVRGIDDLTMTTNASLLGPKARALADAGLRRVTVSLDALDDATFMRMNDVGFPVARVLGGMAAAEAAGLGPIKVNTVVRRDLNEHAIFDLAQHFRGTGSVVRFIEYMDVGQTNGWRLDDVLPASEIVDRIAARWPLEPIESDYRGEVAQRYRYRDGAGEIGVISSVTQPFCGDCTRARLWPTGTCTPAFLPPLATICAGSCAAAPTTSSSRRRFAQSGSVATTATPSCAPSFQTIELPKVEMSFIGG